MMEDEVGRLGVADRATAADAVEPQGVSSIAGIPDAEDLAEFGWYPGGYYHRNGCKRCQCDLVDVSKYATKCRDCAVICREEYREHEAIEREEALISFMAAVHDIGGESILIAERLFGRRELEFVAQAIEARRAETGTGSVHESAVRKDGPKEGHHNG